MYTYRDLAPEDRTAICSFPQNAEELLYMFPKAVYPLTPEQIEESLENRFCPTVILADGVVAGYANFFAQRDKECWMGNVIVSPLHRGKGAARYLVEVMAKRAREEFGAEKLRLVCLNTNTRGLLFYRKQGFQPFAFSVRENSAGEQYVGIHLEKTLNSGSVQQPQP